MNAWNDSRIESLLSRILSASRVILGEDLTGLYVHGSLAFGCFSWDISDVDFLIVARRIPSDGQKAGLIHALLEIDREAPPKGIEMSLLTEEACRRFRHPMPFELHFSHEHLERARKDPEAFAASMRGDDRDLAAHVRITRLCGIPLYGPDPSELFAPVPDGAYTDALLYDIGDAAQSVTSSPVYTVLNLCRVAAWKEERKILSKKEGGEWGLSVLPELYRGTVSDALSAYGRGCGGPGITERESLERFARYMLARIGLSEE